MKRIIYKLKHKPTGLYYVKSGYEHISEKGTIYSTGCHSLCGQTTVYLRTDNQELIKKYLDVFQKVGTLNVEHNKQVYNFKKSIYETVESWYKWSMSSPVSDFEKEVLAYDGECDIKQTVESLREIDSVLEELDEVSQNTTKDYILSPIRKAKKLILELRDIKKNMVRQQG